MHSCHFMLSTHSSLQSLAEHLNLSQSITTVLKYLTLNHESNCSRMMNDGVVMTLCASVKNTKSFYVKLKNEIMHLPEASYKKKVV